MNFRNLQYFLTVAEEKNITHAAKKLYISQQSLSGHIAKLEDELGVALFDRGQELTLTYAGERLSSLARRICSLEQEILRETGEISDHRRGRLRIGISYTCGRAILPYILPEFSKEHPLVEISLMEGNHDRLSEWLKNGEIDVALGYAPIEVMGAKIVQFVKERLFLVCPKNIREEAERSAAEKDTEAREKQFDIHLLEGQPFILLKSGNRVRTLADSYMAKADFVPVVVLETENIETAFALAEQGMGITVYPEIFLTTLHRNVFEENSSVDLFPLPGEETIGTLELAYRENGFRSRALTDFISLCIEKSAVWQSIEEKEYRKQN